MAQSDDTIEINARIRMPSEVLKTIVSNMKQQVGTDQKGIYRIDTAEAVNRLITAFLEEKDFGAYVREMENYNRLTGQPE